MFRKIITVKSSEKKANKGGIYSWLVKDNKKNLSNNLTRRGEKTLKLK